MSILPVGGRGSQTQERFIKHIMKQTLLAIFLVFLFVGCQQEREMPLQTASYSLLAFTKNSVEVAVYLVIDEQDLAQLVTTFTPSEPTLHLYGLDMPPTGIDGVGRPTRVTIISGAIEAAGKLTADVIATEHAFPIFEHTFPLYPDGPVTLSLPVELPDSMPESREAVFSVTYMACSSEGVCKPPVTDRQETVTLPATIWQ